MSNLIPWKPDQQIALDHRNGGAIVTAGAGSGKTAVLNTRIADILCDRTSDIDPSKLAVITFTKKAAAELKTKLIRMMRERMSENPVDAEFIRGRITALHNARISTISSFCFSLVREYINRSTLASGFEIMEESRAAMTRYALAEVAVEEFYKTADAKDLSLILEHFVGKNDKLLIDSVLRISTFASNLPEPDSWYEHCKDKSRLDDIRDSSADEYNATKAEFSRLCDTIEKAYKSICAETKPKAAQIRAKECIEALSPLCADAVKTLDNAVSNNDFTSVTFLDIKKIKETIPPYTKNKVGNDSEDIKAVAETLAKLYDSALHAKETREALYNSQPVIDILIDITRRFEELYAAEKQAMNVADYSDAERQLYNMLKNDPSLKDDIGLQMIVVDEFQDSNRLQYEIFRMLSDNKQNLYFVGDIKQSIYAFRGAQSEVFSEVTKDADYTCLSLNHNFRSRDNVINSINEIFCPIMTEKLGGTDYAKTSQLLLGNPENISVSKDDITEVIVICDNDSDAEPMYVAHRINEMIKSGYMIENRPCTAEDFAIIFRADSSKAPSYAKALARYDISSTTKGGGDFFSEPEIEIMTDYLKIIDNPYNDESLARLLMSGLVGYSADKMAAIRTCTIGFDIAGIRETCEEELKAYASYHQRKPLYACIKAAKKGYEIKEEYFPSLYKLYNDNPELFGSMSDKECTEFEIQLDRLRGVMAASSPAELIKHIYDTTSVADLLTVGENGEKRRANLDSLLSLANNFCSYHSDSILSDFLNHIDNMKKKGQKAELTSGKATSGVQIMSIHASKGLEFPIVFVCDCGKDFNRSDATKDVVMSRKYGISICDVNKSLMSRIPSPSYKKTAEKIIEKLRSEEMRLLYVAATRAKYKLIFTGKPLSKGRKTEIAVEIPANDSSAALLTKDNYLSWILIPFIKMLEQSSSDTLITSAEETVGHIRYQAVSLDDFIGDSSEGDIADTEEDNSSDTQQADSIAEEIKSQITSGYTYKASTEIAAKYTATGLASMKRRDNDNDDEKGKLYISYPTFLREADGKKLSGKKRGDAYHKLMEHIPFDKPVSEQEAADYIRNCTDDFLSDAERDCIKPADISLFFTNEVAQRMLCSEKIYREFPIFHRLSDNILSEVIEDYRDKNITDGCYVQGIADMFFIEKDGIVLVDYKTDSFSDEEKLTEDYSFQLRVYAEALEKAFSLPVKEMFIYSFKKGKMVKI